MSNPALEKLLQKARERKLAAQQNSIAIREAGLLSCPNGNQIPSEQILNPIQSEISNLFQQDGITYNAAQTEFITKLSKGQSCVLIGAAGTGKTTCTKAGLRALIQSGKVPVYTNDGHKHLQNATHGIIICAFTRRAVANIKKGMPSDLQASCLTVHAALEYAPEYYEIQDPITGDYKTTMRFSPTRNKHRPLDETIQYCILEESSMLGVELFEQLKEALHPSCKFVFLGDIQQLPPVFGSAILGYKMLELPVIQLTEVYRQALDSPIISLAHRILSGTEMHLAEMQEWNEKHKTKGLTFHPIQKKTHPEHLLPKIAAFFKKQIADGLFDIEQDVILTPFNKALGTLEINKEIADFLTKKRKAPTYEIIAGFHKLYFAVGDKVLHEKEDAEIIAINRNGLYFGNKNPRKESLTLDRWGFDLEKGSDLEGLEEDDFATGMSVDQIDNMLSLMSASEEDQKERKQEASHCITIRMLADGEEITLSKSSEIHALLLGYCLTVHKSQGSEFRKVYLLLHHSHNNMIARELIYTAVTRAKQELYIICEKDTFARGISKQKVPGDTIAEKAEHFKGKLTRGEY